MTTRAIHRSLVENDRRIEPAFEQASADYRRSADAHRAPSSPPGTQQSTIVNRLSHYLSRPLQQLVPMVFGSSVIAALYAGWIYRDEGHLTPETGVGYWLGIIGGTMMLLLLLYPLRKRMKFLSRSGKVPSWFRLHMLLGVLGPALILFHSNFKLGSPNSNVALAAMLIVVASGIVGRYLYAKVHNGLYGRKADIGEIIDDVETLKQLLGDDLAGAEAIVGALREFETASLGSRRGALSSIGAFMGFGAAARRTRRDVMRQSQQILGAQAKRNKWSRGEKRRRMRVIRRTTELYFAAVRKAARFSVYERLLALWHVLHFPLFVLLVFTAILHVVAVHWY